MKLLRRALSGCLLLIAAPAVGAAGIPASSTQCVLGLAQDWNSSRATLRLYERRGKDWRPAAAQCQARLGRDGLAWGLGLHPDAATGMEKREGDWRSPAGVFAIGGVWSRDPKVVRHPRIPFRRITPRDLWVEDSASPHYNRHLVLEHDSATPWERRQQMKQNDPAHLLKLFIAHNAPPNVVPGAGSSIFFHIWRANGGKPTAGCTTMDERHLRELIAAIDPGRRPVYVLLPMDEYRKRRSEWNLP